MTARKVATFRKLRNLKKNYHSWKRKKVQNEVNCYVDAGAKGYKLDVEESSKSLMICCCATHNLYKQLPVLKGIPNSCSTD